MKKLKVDSNLIEALIHEPVAVGVSGGSDSMALLHFAKTNGFENFFVINFEHGIRGESSVRDSEFVSDYCKDNGITCRVVRLDTLAKAKESGMSTEEAARKLRYDYFDEILKKGVCKYVLLAHHRRDQAETVLMRILRGTGITGLEGIKPINNGIVRPFLNVGKNEISEYIAENGIPFVDDETNYTSDYTRNFIRNEVFPLIKLRYPKVEDSLIRLADIASGINKYLESEAEVKEYDNDTVAIGIDCDSEIFKKAVRQAYVRLGINQDIEYRHYELLLKLRNSNNGASLDMPFFTKAYKEYDNIVITKNTDYEKYEIPFKLPFYVTVSGYKVRIEAAGENIDLKNGLYFDSDKVPENAVLRNRKREDYIVKFGGGRKSLGDYFTDKKIPVRLRDKALTLACGNEILFIAGLAISDKIKIDDKSQNIYKITTEKENGQI